MCDKVSGITIPSNAENYACMQQDMTSSSADVSVTSSSYSTKCGTDEVIKCFLFASYGKTSGSCSQVTTDSETCLFKDDTDNYVWMPQKIGDACLNQNSCDFTLTATGFKDSSGTAYDLASANTDSGYKLGSSNKFKMIPLCGAKTSTTTAEGAIKTGLMTSAAAAWGLASLTV